jgi:hypothetical protein
MTSVSAPPVVVVSVQLEERTYPPYDPFHGTNAPMLWRLVTIKTPKGTGVFEQTDYGHPGRLNPWQDRDIDVALQPQTVQLRAVAESVSALVG